MPDTGRIAQRVYLVGGSQISHAEDATSSVINLGGEAVKIDCSAGRSLQTILAKNEASAIDPRSISTLILTHAHISNIKRMTYWHSKRLKRNRHSDHIGDVYENKR